jgi:hypothetical protein
MVNGQWAMGNGEWSMVNTQSIKNGQQPPLDISNPNECY